VIARTHARRDGVFYSKQEHLDSERVCVCCVIASWALARKVVLLHTGQLRGHYSAGVTLFDRLVAAMYLGTITSEDRCLSREHIAKPCGHVEAILHVERVHKQAEQHQISAAAGSGERRVSLRG